MKQFSIIVVCLNPGEKLGETIRSILEQDCTDYEIVVKDGLGTDGSVEALERSLGGTDGALGSVRIFREKDDGIYDAMNQAVRLAQGEYLLFLNCGDCFYDGSVLGQVKEKMKPKDETPCIYYGDVFEKQTGAVVASNPRLNAFACYRNIPCHQVCFYDNRLFEKRGYHTAYRVRADYEHFLWCYFTERARMRHLPVAAASYEGGGFSETKENKRRSAREHREITRLYMTVGQRIGFRLLLLVTFSSLRGRMAHSRALSGAYNRLKRMLYR